MHQYDAACLISNGSFEVRHLKPIHPIEPAVLFECLDAALPSDFFISIDTDSSVTRLIRKDDIFFLKRDLDKLKAGNLEPLRANDTVTDAQNVKLTEMEYSSDDTNGVKLRDMQRTDSAKVWIAKINPNLEEMNTRHIKAALEKFNPQLFGCDISKWWSSSDRKALFPDGKSGAPPKNKAKS